MTELTPSSYTRPACIIDDGSSPTTSSVFPAVPTFPPSSPFPLSGMRVSSWALVFFFFQAEDGIRDLIVTGVQTCALPICGAGGAILHDLGEHRRPREPSDVGRQVAPQVGEVEGAECVQLARLAEVQLRGPDRKSVV